MALTETAIKAAKPKDKPYMLRDDRGSGLLSQVAGSTGGCGIGLRGRRRRYLWEPTLRHPQEARENGATRFTNHGPRG